MEINLASALLAIVVFQLFLIAFFLLTNKKGKKLSNRLLGIFFLMIGISMLDMWLSFLGLTVHYARIAFLDDGFILALGPLTILYTRSIIYSDFKLKHSILLHYIPFLLVTLYFIIISIVITKEEQIQLVNEVQNFELPWIVNMVGISFYLHASIYLMFAFREVKKYRSIAKEEFSSENQMNHRWIDFTLKSIAIMLVFATIHAIVPYSTSSPWPQISAGLFVGFLLYFANRVILKGLMQPDLFRGISSRQVERYSSSNLKDEVRHVYMKKLSEVIETQKPYLDPDLTINQLARIMEISPKILSQVINQSFEKSFFDYINTYRVEEAKMLFDSSDDEKMTIQEVMYQSGFNSKSSFNTFFKKITGLTPSNYKSKKQ